MTAIALRFEPWAPVTQASDRAQSEDAKWVRHLFQRATELRQSISEDERRRAILEALDEAHAEASFPNWDGYGAIPAFDSSREYAKELVDLLPASMPVPEISADPNGAISFEWASGPRSVFSVSVGRDGTLSFAGLFGHSTSMGTVVPGHPIPPDILNGIRRANRGF